QVAALPGLLTLLVEPDADFRSAGDLLADRVNVLIPRDLLAGHDELAGAGTIKVVALADGPFHQLGTAVEEIVLRAAIGTAAGRGPGVDGVGIVVEHEVRDRVMHDPPALQRRRTNLDHSRPLRLRDRNIGHRPVPDVL